MMMHHDPTVLLALRATTAHVLSARPDAPVVSDPEPSARLAGLRTATATALHRVAGWVEPRPSRRPVSSAGMIGACR
jgi:hypothetical protein